MSEAGDLLGIASLLLAVISRQDDKRPAFGSFSPRYRLGPAGPRLQA